MKHDTKILITGATGFIGRYLVEALQDKGYWDITAIVRKTSSTGFLKQREVKMIHADIGDAESLAESNITGDALFHCAAFVRNSPRSELWQANVTGTENVCRLAVERGIKHFIYTSSVSVVSGNPQVPLVEDLPYIATNLYGESKIEAEKTVRAYRKKGLKSSILRPCMVYGSDEPHLLGLLLKLLRWRILPLINGGNNRLHMVYVKNVVQALIYAMESERLTEKTFFVADDEALTVKELFGTLCRGIGANPPLRVPGIFTPLLLKLPGIGRKLGFFIKDRVYNLDRLKAAGFVPGYNGPACLMQSAREFNRPLTTVNRQTRNETDDG